MKVSILIPMVPNRFEDVLRIAAEAFYGGAHALWQGESLGLDTSQTFAALAGAGFRMRTGIGVSLLPLRHPYEAALQSRSIAMAMGAEVTAGFGPGATSFQASICGAPYRRPGSATKEYIEIVRKLIQGEIVEINGEEFSCHGSLPTVRHAKVSVGAGVLRRRMARLAGSCADTAITWLTPASYVTNELLPALEKGAIDADRPTPRLVCMLPAALERPGRTGGQLAVASNSPHLGAPHYQDMLQKAGADIRTNDVTHNAAQAVAVGAFHYGSADALCESLDRYRIAGVDEVVISSVGVMNTYGLNAALDEIGGLLEVLTNEFGDSK